MKIEDRYSTIIQAALETFARRGYHQASIREIARAADLSLAGLYHYVKGKDELLFLVIDHSLDGLLAKLDAALAEAVTPETKLLALIRVHLDFAFHHGSALKVINRDIEALAEPHRAAAASKRHSYLLRGLEVLCCLDPRGRDDDELLDATNLLLGMLNGIATRPFMAPTAGNRSVADVIKNLFLYGFLGATRSSEPGLAGPVAEPRHQETAHVA